MTKRFIFLVFISLLLFSCKEKEDTFPNLPKEGVYFTDHIWITPSIDLNRDGIKSNDLFDELIYSPRSTMHHPLDIRNREDLGRRILSFSFPYLYADPNDPDFKSLGSNGLQSDFRLEENKIITENPDIISAILLNDSTIEITSVAEFELLEGKKEVEMKSVYVWNSL